MRSLPTVDNFSNLFELPVLLYVAAVLLHVTDRVDGIYLALAWAFIALRYVHSAIHVTYNRVMHRFAIYVLGALPLWAMWARFAAQTLPWRSAVGGAAGVLLSRGQSLFG
ncbi:MAG: hypothetical protein A2140_02695 [Candidatus Muproteobacteria bacterium RBG_16_62_13]|uniref:Uncharacterized protein n=1 Tax=Candidatus Muproteobacteria bacterium RBG_16_62_13 TaxID=1817756 RepID=A0A1F6T4Q7_9PROT|nr:MAG: hypothetical protein A2140_02695 [Candidatus Muproteobacteria bacterium RBG_16_62_13]